MKKGQIVEGVVERVDFPNKGIVQVEETKEQGGVVRYPVAVKGVLPEQKVQIAIKKARKSKCQGILKKVLEPSSKETATPVCPYFGSCGGCNYQTLPYEEQLNLKKQQVLSLLRPVCEGISDFVYDGIFPAPSQWAYRNKMEFSFGDEIKNGPLTLGLHKKNSFHDIITVSGCQIVHHDYSLILDCVRDFCSEKELPHYKKTTHEGLLRHLLIRRGEKTGELLIALVTSSQYQEEQMENILQELSAKLQNLPLEGTLTGFLHIVNDSLADVVQSDVTNLIYGKDWFCEEILGLQFRITPFSFFQTNTRGAELLYQKAREYVLNNGQTNNLQGKVVYDLYSGTGTIAQILAPVAGKVIGVEIVEEAVDAARENAARNGLQNCEFIAGDVLKVLDEISEKPDFIVLDPPRDGIHPKALKRIIGYGVPQLVYISCKPTSLARDLVVMQEAGYRVERVCNVDLFANTVHVETVCLLLKKP
jgi:23S rRNA (uracil-5-)-methyltransferase RumA